MLPLFILISQNLLIENYINCLILVFVLSTHLNTTNKSPHFVDEQTRRLYFIRISIFILIITKHLFPLHLSFLHSRIMNNTLIDIPPPFLLDCLNLALILFVVHLFVMACKNLKNFLIASKFPFTNIYFIMINLKILKHSHSY